MIGEGGSGGAIAIATANKVLMLEHAIYTVASPEAAASILWRDSSRAQDAATSMKITAQDLIKFGIIDGIVPEPVGGAHRDPAAAVAATGQAIGEALEVAAEHERRAIARGAGGEVSGDRAEGVAAPPSPVAGPCGRGGLGVRGLRREARVTEAGGAGPLIRRFPPPSPARGEDPMGRRRGLWHHRRLANG